MKKKSVYHLENRATLNDLPQEIHFMIADELDFKSAASLSLATRQLFFHLNQTDYLYSRAKKMIELYGEKFINKAIAAIKLYLAMHKPTPNPWFYPGDETAPRPYDKGFHRATCFLDILSQSGLSISFRIFVINTLLNEKNGERLKAFVSYNLPLTIKLAEGELLTLMNLFVSKAYPRRQDMQIRLLEKIHGCYKTYAYGEFYEGYGPVVPYSEGGWCGSRRCELTRLSLVTNFWKYLEKEICAKQQPKSDQTCSLM